MTLEIIDKDILKDVLDDMVWSFSRIGSFNTCKLKFYKKYILGEQDENNFFTEYGSFIHSILEKYSKGELELFDLVGYYKDNYDMEVCLPAPPNKYVDLRESYYKKGLKYFENFEGFGDETVGTEQEIKLDLDLKDRKIKFIGYIDRLSKDEDGEFKILDHKSKAGFKTDEELKEYLRQLYLYSIYVKNTYGKYPKTLQFNMFREGEQVVHSFDLKELEETLEWVRNTINNIYSETEFAPKTKEPENDFFCKYLCGFKGNCQKFDN